MSNICVSVIIPVYNSENLLSQCLDSVINQTLKNIEIICVDDGSSDNSLNVLKDYEKRDNRIKVISQKNSGAGVARNNGLDNAQGEFIAFLDSDDWLDEDALEKLLKNITKNNADMTLFNAIEFKPNNQFRKRIYFQKDDNIDYNNFTFDYHFNKNLVMNGMLVIWSKFYRTSFLKENTIRFYNHEIFNDVQFHIKTMLLAKKISYLPEILYNYRRLGQNSLQTSRAVTNKGFIVFNIFEEIKEWLIETGFYKEFEANYIRFVLNESQVRLNNTNEYYKEELFKIIKEKFIEMNVSSDILKDINIKNHRFYIHIINSNSYFEYKQFENTQNMINSDLSLSYELDKKIKEYKKLEETTNDFIKNIDLNLKIIEKIKKYELFDQEFYIRTYDYNEELDPLLHYVFRGHRLGYKPNEYFDEEIYSKMNKNVEKSGIDPFIYFILYGMDEGIIKFNNNIHQPSSINKIELTEKINHFNKIGVNTQKRNPQLIVSITSYPERMYDIHYCLYSILTQELKPDKVILWLAQSQFPNKEKDIPQTVLSLKENGLEIKWCEDMKSFKKLLPSLKAYPEDIIVTADDDIYYPEQWLKDLYESYLKHPTCIISQRSREITLNEDYTFKSYNEWPLLKEIKEPSYLNFFTGAGGVLYPPKCLHEDVLDYNLAKKLTPNGDDIWFWIMAVLNKTKIKVVGDYMVRLTYVNPARELNLINEKTLWYSNSKGNNDNNIKNILDNFSEVYNIIYEDIK